MGGEGGGADELIVHDQEGGGDEGREPEDGRGGGTKEGVWDTAA